MPNDKAEAQIVFSDKITSVVRHEHKVRLNVRLD